MKVLIVAEHDDKALCAVSLSCFTFAKQLADAAGGEVAWLVLGDRIENVAADAARLAPVFAVQSPLLARPLAEPWARAIAAVVQGSRIDMVAAAASTFSKDILPRACAVSNGAMASDVIGYEFSNGHVQFDSPQFAGAVVATIRLVGTPQFVTVRSSAFTPAARLQPANHLIKWIEVDPAALTSRCQFAGLKSKSSNRPDVTEARVVVAGGRAIQSSEDFEAIAGRLADVLGGAVGSTRALVDAGIAPIEQKIGQTGKIIAPDLYIALGISGAVQHVAGIKNSRTIVAINSDPEAPIFEFADLGLVGDVYRIVPELIEKLERRLGASSNCDHDTGLKTATP